MCVRAHARTLPFCPPTLLYIYRFLASTPFMLNPMVNSMAFQTWGDFFIYSAPIKSKLSSKCGSVMSPRIILCFLLSQRMSQTWITEELAEWNRSSLFIGCSKASVKGWEVGCSSPSDQTWGSSLWAFPPLLLRDRKLFTMLQFVESKSIYKQKPNPAVFKAEFQVDKLYIILIIAWKVIEIQASYGIKIHPEVKQLLLRVNKEACHTSLLCKILRWATV